MFVPCSLAFNNLTTLHRAGFLMEQLRLDLADWKRVSYCENQPGKKLWRTNEIPLGPLPFIRKGSRLIEKFKENGRKQAKIKARR